MTASDLLIMAPFAILYLVIGIYFTQSCEKTFMLLLDLLETIIERWMGY